MDTFMGWTDVFPTQMAKTLLKEIIPRFGLPRTLKSDNGPAFISQITQWIAQTLGIKYCLHSAWRPQSSSKEEKANQMIKWILAKLAKRPLENGSSFYL
jgi:transposase InsO family protein